jgi:hypothetical protein
LRIKFELVLALDRGVVADVDQNQGARDLVDTRYRFWQAMRPLGGAMAARGVVAKIDNSGGRTPAILNS